MNDYTFDQLLQERERFLESIVAEKESAALSPLPGRLRIVSRGQDYYYIRTNPKDTNGIYIPRKDFSKAAILAQQEYDRKIYQIAREELSLIRKLRKKMSLQSVESCYPKLSQAHQRIIEPAILTDEAFAKQWQEMPFHGKKVWYTDTEYLTNRGERVRSKSEILIANALDLMKVSYHYEKECYLAGYGSVFPDFTALNARKRKEYIWEHLGMMDDPDYAARALKKIRNYEKNGYFPGDRLLITYETSSDQLETKTINRVIETFLL